MNVIDSIASYGQAWLEHDEAKRRLFLEQAWAPDAVYCDPLAWVPGIDALVTHIGEFQESMPGSRVEIAGEPMRHHDSAHFPWTIFDADGNTVLTGFDVVQLDDQGRISRLTGFFDAPAS